MTDKLSKAAQQALYAMAMLLDPEKLEPWQIELYDKSTNALRAALAEQPAEQEPVSHIGWLVRDADGRLDLLTDLQIESSLSKYERLSKLYTAPQPAKPAEQEPVAWLNPHGGVLQQPRTGLERSTYTIPLYTAPQPAKPAEQEPYDQTALELCDVCGWKTLIPGDGCLNCERQTAKREPLTDEDVQDLLKVGNPTEDEYRLIRMGWDAAHGIGGQE